VSFQFKDNSSLLLNLENITKKYPNGVQALKGINLNVFRGEFLAVIGLSGSGKSTLLRCINKIHDPSSGNIFFSGQNITNIKESQLKLVRSKIGMIFQNFNLIERKNVLHNVLLGRLSLRQALFLGGIFHPWPEEWIAEAYEALQKVGLKEKALIRADGLSGGQKQRVAIARTLLQNPELILADEPVASLDPSTSYSVMNYLKDLNQNKNITIVCNLHFLSLVREYSTRVIALKNGELIFEGKPSEISAKWFRNIYGEDAREVEIQ
jgi:phosphonate transport system ATP-binding protein